MQGAYRHLFSCLDMASNVRTCFWKDGFASQSFYTLCQFVIKAVFFKKVPCQRPMFVNDSNRIQNISVRPVKGELLSIDFTGAFTRF